MQRDRLRDDLLLLLFIRDELEKITSIDVSDIIALIEQKVREHNPFAKK